MGKYTKKSAKFFEGIREVNGVIEKKCTQCEEWKPLNNKFYYYKNKYKPEKGFGSECKICSVKRTQKNRTDNIEKRKEYDKIRNAREYDNRKGYFLIKRREYYESGYYSDYFEKYPDKLKQYQENHRDHDITNSEWEHCKDFFKDENGNWICAYCGITEEKHKNLYGEQLHKDHTNHEGSNDIKNCTPSCKICNSQKHQSNMEEWFRKQIFFTEDKLNKIKIWNDNEYKKYIKPKPPYKIKRRRIENKDGTYKMQHELWSVDEQRNVIECLAIKDKKKQLDEDIKIYLNYLNKEKLK